MANKSDVESTNQLALARKIYVLENKYDLGWLKIGETHREVATRVKEQVATMRDGTINIVHEDETTFSDKAIHAMLKEAGFRKDKEWVQCSLDDVKSAIVSLKAGKPFQRTRINDFKPRPEQTDAVKKTVKYFKEINHKKSPKFMWNAKMRFGKCFTTYKLAQAMGWQKILVLTFKPAVMASWKEDLETHTDFDDWHFLNVKNFEGDEISKHATNKIVCFGSLQDVLHYINGEIKTKNEEVHLQDWDCVVFDEFHYGAWRDRTQDKISDDKNDELSDDENKEFGKNKESIEIENNFDVNDVPIKGNHFLYLSGTPFRALSNGDFLEDQIYNWTYIDEQEAKQNWLPSQGDNPYKYLPQIKMYTYAMPDTIRAVASQGEFDEFALNEFFKAEIKNKEDKNEIAKFKHEDKVVSWLNFISGQDDIVNNLKRKEDGAILPFTQLNINHTFWYLPSVASCFAMENLLKENKFFASYTIITVAGKNGGTGSDALAYLNNNMVDKPKTITLSCGKLTTGVSVKEWQAIFMLRDIKSPESYFQSAFRVQTPNVDKNNKDIYKEVCYIFDFAPNRALSQLTEYVCGLSIDDEVKSPKEKVADFIKFLPVLAYDGSSMKELDADGIYEFSTSITTASMLAKCWTSATLVDVSNNMLEAILNNPKALEILEKFKPYRNLKGDIGIRKLIENVITIEKDLKKLKTTNSTDGVSHKKEVDEKLKERQSQRQKIREKLLLLAQRLPVFMYLSDHREQALSDVIEKLEPDLFNDTTSLTVDDFKVLVEIGVFNIKIMNNAVYKFRLYEENSLKYI